jgi:hypothetical protein
MKNLVTVLAFVAMNGVGFVGYRAMSHEPATPDDDAGAPAARSLDDDHPATPRTTPARRPAPAPQIRSLPVDDDTEAPTTADDGAPAAEAAPAHDRRRAASHHHGRHEERRIRPRERGGDAVEHAAPAEAVAPAPSPPAPAAAAARVPAEPPAARPDAARPRTHLLDEMESNPYKRSD